MRFLVVTVLALAPVVASAEQTFNHFDLYYRSSNIDIGFDLAAGDESGDGLGLRFSRGFYEKGFLFAEYEGAGYEKLENGFFFMEPSTKLLRLGVGGHTGGERLDWYGAFSYVKAEVAYGPDADDENSGSGFGLKGGVRVTLAQWAAAFAELGTVDAGDIGGGEYGVGLDFSVGRRAGVILEYGVSNLDIEQSDTTADIDNKVTDVRAGVRVRF